MTNPTFPRAKSLEAYSLVALLDKAGAGITHRTVDRMAHSYRLSAYIHCLKKKGWQITATDEQVSVFYGSRNAPISRYTLSAEQLAYLRVGIGAQFIERVRGILRDAKAGGNRLEHTANTTTTQANFSTGGAQ